MAIGFGMGLRVSNVIIESYLVLRNLKAIHAEIKLLDAMDYLHHVVYS